MTIISQKNKYLKWIKKCFNFSQKTTSVWRIWKWFEVNEEISMRNIILNWEYLNYLKDNEVVV